ncbi:hypothetical protein GYN07_16305 [Rhizobium leguminosarum bv. viciae 248]|uniref:hypothetical protein n=1 Tax=Rhizobium leguminosarum TaxID=384 RepID=UPI00037D4B98|nr:hypothetical protein [Rhizobium leguminosarum]QHW25807.1 hypothetical protein GYN07_16305 [Rhizobium leguminosarum bv. viciae 248]
MDETKLAKFEKIADQQISSGQTAYADLSKWILASLLALNGGALLVFVQVTNTYPKLGASYSPMLFLMGALFAIASGLFAQKRNLTVSLVFMKFLMADTDDRRAAELKDGLKAEKFFERGALASVLMSVVALAAGAFFLWMLAASLLAPATP